MADLTAFCGFCPLIGIFSRFLLIHSQTHIPQGTCPECVGKKVRRDEWDIAACCVQQGPLFSALPPSPRTSSVVESSSQSMTSTTPELPLSTGGLPDPSGTELGRLPGTSSQPDLSPSPTGQGQSPDFLSLPNTILSSSTSPTTNFASETSVSSFATKHSKPPNVVAIAVGVAAAVLLFVVCGAIIFYLRRKKQKKQPPSAEFMGVAASWQPRAYHETTSPISSTFIPKDSLSFASPHIEPLRFSIPTAPYSPTPTTPRYSP